jgi:hypothetical protein
MFALRTHTGKVKSSVLFKRPSWLLCLCVCVHMCVEHSVYMAVCELCTAGPACEGVHIQTHSHILARVVLHTLSQSPSEHRGRRAAAAAAVDR